MLGDKPHFVNKFADPSGRPFAVVKRIGSDQLEPGEPAGTEEAKRTTGLSLTAFLHRTGS